MQRSSGFTLVEALVAVTLLALLFGALMPVFQNGLAVLRSGDRHSRAVLLAQSVLDHQLALGRTKEAVAAAEVAEQGTFGDYRWQVTRTAFVAESADAVNDAALNESVPDSTVETGPFELQHISVVVRWPENEFGVQLHTLALEAVR